MEYFAGKTFADDPFWNNSREETFADGPFWEISRKKLSRKGQKTAKPRKFFPAKVSSFKVPSTQKACLVWDAFSGQDTGTVKEKLQIFDIAEAKVPKNMTHLLQPLDLTTNGTAKMKPLLVKFCCPSVTQNVRP